MTASPKKKSSEKRSSPSSSQKRSGGKRSSQQQPSESNSRSRSPRSSASDQRLTVMGLDLSPRSTGLVVLRGQAGEKPKVLRARTLRTQPLGETVGTATSGLRPSGNFRGDNEECIEWTKRKIRSAFRKFQPDLVVIEDYPYVKNSKALSFIYEQGGVIRNLMHLLEAVWVVRKPQPFKVFATGSGNADKAAMVIAAKADGFPATNSDLADAYWMAKFGIEKYDELLDTAGENEL